MWQTVKFASLGSLTYLHFSITVFEKKKREKKVNKLTHLDRKNRSKTSTTTIYHHGIGRKVPGSCGERVVLDVASSLLEHVDMLEIDETFGPFGYVKVALFDEQSFRD